MSLLTLYNISGSVVVDGELEGIVVYFKLLSHRLLGETEGNYEDRIIGLRMENRTPNLSSLKTEW
jgi:hypothetical protein